MGIFGIGKKNKEISMLKKDIIAKDKRIKELKNLCEEKDSFFSEIISDGLRHGSPKAAKHMAEKKKYLKRK